MAKVTGPLLSFSAAGQIASTQVYSRWKGRPYVRRLVIPANPRSTDQMLTRNVFSWLSNTWKIAPSDFIAPWNAYAKGKVLTGRNAYMGQNISILRDATDLTGLILSPGAGGGLTVPPTITFGAGSITIDLVAPSPLPSGWTIVHAVGAAIRDQDPHSGTFYEIVTGFDATSTYSIVLPTLAAGDWAAGGWFVYQRSPLASDIAYGASIAELGTVT